MRPYLALLVILCFSGQLKSQTKPLKLANASFEGFPHDAITPDGWNECGMDSSPDIMPGPWGVYQKPTDGSTFVGLITRENNSWESMGQKLTKAFKKNKCYKFKVDLSSSPAYAGYSKPTCLRVWLGNASCQRSKLVVSSALIDHYEWKTYEFMFSTDQEYKFILIECYYKQPALHYYRGNLLIDNFSVFEMCDRA